MDQQLINILYLKPTQSGCGTNTFEQVQVLSQSTASRCGGITRSTTRTRSALPGPIGGIAPQVLAVNYSYVLPFGRGQAFLSGVSNLVDKLVSGWQISGISSFQNGQPFSATYTAPGITGLVSGRADVVPGVPLYPAKKTKSAWFNTAAFQAPQCYANTGLRGLCTAALLAATGKNPLYAIYGNSAYDMLRGPRFQDWDMSL